jgi:hypothetical protein
MSLLPWTTLHSDSEQLPRKLGAFSHTHHRNKGTSTHTHRSLEPQYIITHSSLEQKYFLTGTKVLYALPYSSLEPR